MFVMALILLVSSAALVRAEDVRNADQMLCAAYQATRCTSEAELEELLTALDQRRTASLEKVVDGRFKITELMTAAEWDQVYSIVAQSK